MSGKRPRVTARETVRALHRDGWYDDAQVGSHLSLRHPTKPGKVIVPIHTGRTLKPALLAQILKDAQLDVDKFRSLL
jgi:predicted RNA binding protein YcfA (HicA-like mRNA interferase family)